MQAILADVSEIFDRPFSEVALGDVEYAFGSDYGSDLMGNVERLNKKSSQKNAEKLSRNERKMRNLVGLYNAITDKEVFDEHYLSMLALYRVGNVVYHKYMHRRVNYVDCEHWLCKAYLLSMMTDPTRIILEDPDMAKPYCWLAAQVNPMWWSANNMAMEETWSLDKVMKECVDSFQVVVQKMDHHFHYPAYSLYDGKKCPLERQ